MNNSSSNRLNHNTGLKEVRISGYKSISNEIKVKINPLTVIAGANSSGKSSVMQTILLLKQTLESHYDPGVILINGSNIAFTKLNQMFSSTALSEMCLNIAFQFDEDSFVSVSYRVNPRRRTIFISDFKYGDSELLISGILQGAPQMLNDIEIEKLYGGFLPKENKLQFIHSQRRCLVDISIVNPSGNANTPFITPPFVDRIRSIITNSIHLPGLRGNPERNYLITQYGFSRPGKFESYVAGIIWHWYNSDRKVFDTLIQHLNRLELTNKLSVSKVEDYAIEIQVAKSSSSDILVNIADVGLGVSQVLPILVALLVATRGQSVFIEQPEIHLHPKAQGQLAYIISEAVNRGVRVVVETHSSNLLLSIQTLIARDILDYREVSLHWFSKVEDGSTVVETATMEYDGSFGDWPENFDDTLINQQDELISAIEEKLNNDRISD